MQKKFELWLDESGEFYKEKEKRRENMLPSLIGGFLVPAEKVSTVLNLVSMDSDRNHAMHLSERDKREYVLPVLQKLVHEQELSMVFFENAQYEDAPSNRQLYLRLMAEGILQLLQKLDGLYESVDLAVWIAQRRDVHNPNPDKARIDEAEYVAMLQKVMEQKRKNGRILLNEDTKVHFVVCPAHRQQRLQFADFACNTRLTRFSEAFDSVRGEVERLYDTAHLFDLHESSSENYIKICMEKGDMADAIMELFTTWESIDRGAQLDYVMAAMESRTIEQNEVMLQQCGTEIEAYVYHQEDYLLGQLFLEHLSQELLPRLKEHKLPCRELQLKVNMLLVELYIKQGNVWAAEKRLAQSKQLCAGLVGRTELVWNLYAKEAILYHEQGNYEAAEAWMEKVCHSYKRAWNYLEMDSLLAEMGVRLSGRGYLDALSIYIYMLLDRQQEEGAKVKLRAMLEEAIKLAETDGVGKLERLHRYYALLEARDGRIKDALKKLLGVEQVVEDYTLRQQLSGYLKKLQLQKDSREIQFGVMYYLAIMVQAAKEETLLARTMFGVLGEQYALLEFLGLRSAMTTLPNEVDISSVSQQESQNKGYHPIEQIYGYYGEYLALQGKYTEALTWYRKATAVCFANPEYFSMMIAGLKIVPKLIECIRFMGNTGAAEYEKQEALKKIEILLKGQMSEQARAYVISLTKEI